MYDCILQDIPRKADRVIDKLEKAGVMYSAALINEKKFITVELIFIRVVHSISE